MKKKFSKFLGVGLALVLVCSFSLVTAVPVGAEDGPLGPPDAVVFPFELGGEADSNYVAEWSTAKFNEGSSSVHLQTTGTVGAGDEARILIDLSGMPEGEELTLGDIETISWWVYAVTGYPPHLDITLDTTDVDQSMLTAEMNLNCVGAPKSIATLTGEISYSAGWLQTFELTSGDGFGAINDSTTFWVTKMGSGDLNAPSGTLADWKGGTVTNDPGVELAETEISSATVVTAFEIEVDNWVVQSEAYVDDITIRGVGDDPILLCGQIQDAIDSVSGESPFIYVEAGIYDECLNVNKSVSIVGAGVSDVTISTIGTGFDNAGIYVSVDDVSLQGFTQVGNPDAASPRYGIKFADVSGGSVMEVLARDNYRTGFDFLGTMNTTVSNISSRDNVGHGIQLCDSTDIALSDITVSGNGWEGVNVATWGHFTTLGTSGIVFSGTNSFVDVFQLEEGDYNNPNVAPAGDAIITYSTNLADGADVTVQASDFGYALHGDQNDGPGQNRVWFFKTLAEAQAVASVPLGHFDGNGIYIESLTDRTQLYISPGCEIQAAIDAANPEGGDTITVAAGTYNENITIDRTLTLEGAQAGENAFERTGPESIIDAQLADFAVFIIGAETVATLDGFTVLNYEVGGILAGAFSPPEDDPLVVHILNNVVEAPSPLEDAHNNNIQMGDGTTGTVIGNEVSGAHLEHPDWSGSGIIVASTNGVLISNNHAYSCDIGIAIIGYTHGGRTPSEGNIIEYNDVESCGAGIGVQRQSIGTIIRYNDVSNNDAGIESAGYPDDVPSGTEVHYNNIVGNLEYGVASIIWGEDPGVPEEVDATLNWWGDPSGPDGAQDFGPETYTGVLPGTGDSVSGNVKCQPWLTRPFKTVLEDDIAYFGISFPALKGWNIVSAPLALDKNVSVTVGGVTYPANTWGGLLNLGKIAEGDDYALKLHYTGDVEEGAYTPIWYYDSDPDSPNVGWRQATELTEINPVDAFYIRMMESDSFPVLFSPDRSVPSKELYKGWNLVGCAYMSVLTEEEGLALETALATIESVSSPTGDVTGYDQVVSPSMNQPSWTFIPGPEGGTYIPESVEGETILIGKGYWVFMENPGTLAGLTFTPISLPK